MLRLSGCCAPRYVGRQRLPALIRNRFLRICVGEFPRDELSIIIQNMRVEMPAGTTPRRDGIVDETTANFLAEVYVQAPKIGINMTMREIVKIVRRYRLLSRATAGQDDLPWEAAVWTLLVARLDASPASEAHLAGLIANASGLPVDDDSLVAKLSVARGGARVENVYNAGRTVDGVRFVLGDVEVFEPGANLLRSPLFQHGRT